MKENFYMARWLWNSSLLFLFVFSCLVRTASALTIVDDRGKTIELKAPARRIIALYGAFNEIIASLGREELLIARTKADRDPASILKLPEIGTHMRPNVELIVSLKPDLILQSTGRRLALEPVRILEKMGFKVAVFNPNSITGLYSSILRIGILIGEEKKAKVLVESMKNRIEHIQRQHTGKRTPRVFFEVRYPNLLGAGGNNIVSEIIEKAGGINCFSGVRKKFVRPGLEAVLKCDPDFYIIQKGPMNRAPGNPENRPNFTLLRAIREGHWLMVPEGKYSRPTPNIVEAIEELSKVFMEYDELNGQQGMTSMEDSK